MKNCSRLSVITVKVKDMKYRKTEDVDDTPAKFLKNLGVRAKKLLRLNKDMDEKGG